MTTMHVCSFIGLLSLAIVQSSRADDFTPIAAYFCGSVTLSCPQQRQFLAIILVDYPGWTNDRRGRVRGMLRDACAGREACSVADVERVGSRGCAPDRLIHVVHKCIDRLSFDQQHCSACSLGDVITYPSGYIASPGYTSAPTTDHTQPLTCSRACVLPPPTKSTALVVRPEDVDFGSGDDVSAVDACAAGVVIVYDGSSGGKSEVRCCGSRSCELEEVEVADVEDVDRVSVNFRSDGYIGRGFLLYFTVAPVHGECRSFAADSIDVGTTAAPPVVVIQQAVKLTSQQCWWKLVAPPGRRLLVHVTYGVCSAVANSRFDIYEYVGGAQRHLLDTCNEMQSVYITSQTNAVVIYLKGEPAAVYQGFEAFVEAYSVYNSVGMKMLSPQSTTVPVAPSMGTMRAHTDGVNESTATPSILTSEVSSGSAISAPAETVAPPARGGKLFMVVASVAAAVAVLLIVGLTAYIVITRRRNRKPKFQQSASLLNQRNVSDVASPPPPGGAIHGDADTNDRSVDEQNRMLYLTIIPDRGNGPSGIYDYTYQLTDGARRTEPVSYHEYETIK